MRSGWRVKMKIEGEIHLLGAASNMLNHTFQVYRLDAVDCGPRAITEYPHPHQLVVEQKPSRPPRPNL